MMKRFLPTLAVLGLSIASAESYHVVLKSSEVEGASVKAGDYRLDLQDGKAVITHGKQKLEVPVQVENANQKYASTNVVYTGDNGRYAIREIQLRGTTTKLVFSPQTGSSR
jgi:hypothetical protein